jgi:Lrp/AsnC family leucine-responsive transcriptional regulator
MHDHAVSKEPHVMTAMSERNTATPPYDLQEVDRQILAELAVNARVGKAELARRVALSPPGVAQRLKWLENAGVIRGYHVDIDPAALGYPVGAVVRVRPAVRQILNIQRLAEEQPEVVECHRITGDDSFVMKVYARSVQHLQQILDRFLTYGQTTTSIIHSTTITPRCMPFHL